MARIRGDPSARDMSLRTASSMGELDEGKEQGGKSGHSERKLTDGAGGRTRTDTTFYGPRILSPVRLPFRHTGRIGHHFQEGEATPRSSTAASECCIFARCLSALAVPIFRGATRKRRPFLKVAWVLSLACLAANCILALGADVNPFGPTDGFNVFVEGNYTNSGGQLQGPAAAGSDLIFMSGTIAQSSGGSYRTPGETPPSALVVGGSVQWGSSSGNLLVVQPANVKIGKPPYAVWSSNPNATIINNGPDDGATPRIETRA